VHFEKNKCLNMYYQLWWWNLWWNCYSAFREKQMLKYVLFWWWNLSTNPIFPEYMHMCRKFPLLISTSPEGGDFCCYQVSSNKLQLIINRFKIDRLA
jgi:hypothetical protein